MGDHAVREEGVLTIATGNAIYVQLAANLARSFRAWNAGTDIGFVLATDQPDLVPADLDGIDVIALRRGQYGLGFSPKLYLNEMLSAQRTIFLDADCLCVGNMAPVFERFRGHAVSVVGRYVRDGEWFGDVRSVCAKLGLEALPRFNGGLYYVERGDQAERVYRTAQELEPRYRELGLIPLRGRPNDEVLMSVAMALNGERPILDDGTIMNSTLAAPGGVDVDVLAGRSRLANPKDHPSHNLWYEREEMRPLVVHFLGADIERHPYRREEICLQLVMLDRWPVWLARLWSRVTFSWPWLVKERLKRAARPLYHRLFGVQPVRVVRDRT